MADDVIASYARAEHAAEARRYVVEDRSDAAATRVALC